MTRVERFLAQVLTGRSDSTIRFAELRNLLLRLGFDERIRGSHHVFSRAGVPEILNLQPRGQLAKPYQVKQVRLVIVKYGLTGDPDDPDEA